MDSSKAFPQRRSDVSSRTINSSCGALICGSPLKCLMMSSLPSRFRRSLISPPAYSPTGKWCCALMKRAICTQAPTLPTRPGSPTRLEHEYKRAGALHLFAAFDTRTGQVYARTERRKRQVEFIAFLSQLEQELPLTKTQVYLVMDNLKMHKGRLVQAWLATHPRFV